MEEKTFQNFSLTFHQKWTPSLKMQTASNLLQQLIDTSSHQNSSEIQMQIQIQMWPHRRWLGYMTRHQQGKVMFTVLFSSKCIWDAPLRNVCFRERLRDLLVLLGRCSREVARFCGAARLRESLLKIVTILLLKYSTISSLQSATLIIVVFFSKKRGFQILWSRGCVSLAHWIILLLIEETIMHCILCWTGFGGW